MTIVMEMLVGLLAGVAVGPCLVPLASGLVRRRLGGAPEVGLASRALATLACALMLATLCAQSHSVPETASLAVLLIALEVAAIADLEAWLIPNACVVVALLARAALIVWVGVSSGVAEALALLRASLVGMLAVTVPLVVLALVLDRVLGAESLGGGDVKLLAVCAAHVGWRQSVFLMLAACALGVLGVGVASLAARGRQGADLARTAFPFGPAICAAAWLTTLTGPAVVAWYLGILA